MKASRQIIISLASLALLFFLSSCVHESTIDIKNVDRVVFYAMPKGIERCASIVSFDDLKREARDTTITDRLFVNKFVRMANSLRPDRERTGMDMRSAAQIITRQGEIYTIAFGENWGIAFLNDTNNSEPSPFRVNGRFMKDNPKIFSFIDKYVYGPHQNDYWFGDTERIFIKNVQEYYESQGWIQ